MKHEKKQTILAIISAFILLIFVGGFLFLKGWNEQSQKERQREENMFTSQSIRHYLNKPVLLHWVEIDHKEIGGNCSTTGVYLGQIQQNGENENYQGYYNVSQSSYLDVDPTLQDLFRKICIGDDNPYYGGVYKNGVIGCNKDNSNCQPWTVVITREGDHFKIKQVQ